MAKRTGPGRLPPLHPGGGGSPRGRSLWALGAHACSSFRRRRNCRMLCCMAHNQQIIFLVFDFGDTLILNIFAVYLKSKLSNSCHFI